MKTVINNIRDRKHFVDRYVDMHMHTTASDGSYCPRHVIKGAYKKGIRVISITDHDNVGGVLEASKTANKLGMEFHTGIEMTTDIIIGNYYKNGQLVGKPLKTELHILGYDIDTEDEAVNEFCNKTALFRADYNLKIMNFLKEKYGVGPDEIGRKYIKGYLGKPQIAEAFQKTGTIKTIDEIQERVFNDTEFLSITKERIMAYEAIKIIREAGGEAVLAHPGRIKYIGQRESEDFFLNVEIILKELMSYGIEGLECVYLRHTDAEKYRFLKLAEKYKLIPTRGTDFHS